MSGRLPPEAFARLLAQRRPDLPPRRIAKLAGVRVELARRLLEQAEERPR